MTLPATSRPGPVHLRVRDLDRVREFWVGWLGLLASPAMDGSVHLAAEGGDEPLLVLHSDPSARPAGPDAPGLYHLALLVPDRAGLGRIVARALRERIPLRGASDHGVSEALYLAGPEGNGIEIYADRPRESWDRDGEAVRMTTRPLDLRSLVADAGGVAAGIPRGTRMGHVHLRVDDLEASEAFYGPRGLGLDVTTREYPGARFLSAGGYHHHLGTNVWGVSGSYDPEAAGLAAWTLVIPDVDEASAAATRVGARPEDGGWIARDPDGIPLRIRTEPEAVASGVLG